MTRRANAQVDDTCQPGGGKKARCPGKLSQCGCMVGFWYSAVHVKSEQSHRVEALLGSRDQLVRAKRALGNQVRGVLRPFGIRLPSRQGTKKFSTAAHQAVRHDAMFNASVTALLEALAAIEAQIARLDQQLKELARRSQVCWRL
jgi:transposase